MITFRYCIQTILILFRYTFCLLGLLYILCFFVLAGMGSLHGFEEVIFSREMLIIRYIKRRTAVRLYMCEF